MEYLYGTLHVAVDMDITEIHRVCLSQNGTHYAEMYYPDYTDEEIQKIQDLEQAQFDTMYELGKQAAQEDLQPTCNNLATDCISRKAAIDALMAWEEDSFWDEECLKHRDEPYWVAPSDVIEHLPSAQPERTCVNCGRTMNNGGWYADGRTRCPIEEHYALPKDGFCHLWEKRNITDDDYPERREE